MLALVHKHCQPSIDGLLLLRKTTKSHLLQQSLMDKAQCRRRLLIQRLQLEMQNVLVRHGAHKTSHHWLYFYSQNASLPWYRKALLMHEIQVD